MPTDAPILPITHIRVSNSDKSQDVVRLPLMPKQPDSSVLSMSTLQSQFPEVKGLRYFWTSPSRSWMAVPLDSGMFLPPPITGWCADTTYVVVGCVGSTIDQGPVTSCHLICTGQA
jgi:hypothetical protein